MGIDPKQLPESAQAEIRRQIRDQDRRGFDANCPVCRATLTIPDAPRHKRGPRQPHKMRPWEAEWQVQLLARQHAGELRLLGQGGFEALKFRLADGCYYTPDFAMIVDGMLELHEVKGFMREAARLRYKIAQEQYPFFKFRMFKKEGGSWKGM